MSAPRTRSVVIGVVPAINTVRLDDALGDFIAANVLYTETVPAADRAFRGWMAIVVPKARSSYRMPRRRARKPRPPWRRARARQ